MTIYQTLDKQGNKETWINTVPYLDADGVFRFNGSIEGTNEPIRGHMWPCELNPGQMIKVTAVPHAMELVREEGYYHAKKYGSYYFIQYKNGRWLSRHDSIIDDETIKLYEISNIPVPQSCLLL